MINIKLNDLLDEFDSISPPNENPWNYAHRIWLIENIEKQAKILGVKFLFTVCGNKHLENIHKKLDWWIDKSRTSYETFKYI